MHTLCNVIKFWVITYKMNNINNIVANFIQRLNVYENKTKLKLIYATIIITKKLLHN